MKLKMTLPIIALSVVLFLLPSVSLAQSAEENLWKFDEGFYTKILEMQDALDGGVSGQSGDLPPTRSVIIITDEGYEDRVEEVLQELNATNIFKSTKLGFVNADIPINNIINLTRHDFIYKLGDGQEAIYGPDPIIAQSPQGEGHENIISWTQAKAIINASNIPSTLYPFTGRGIIIGMIDSPIDYTHMDLQNKISAGTKLCDSSTCDLDIPAGIDRYHGTAIAGVLITNINDTSRNGIAPDSRIFSTSLNNAEIIMENASTKGVFARAFDEILSDGRIKIALSSRGGDRECMDYSALTIIMDRAVEQGPELFHGNRQRR